MQKIGQGSSEGVKPLYEACRETQRKLHILEMFIEEEGIDVEGIYEAHRKYINGKST